MNRYVSNDLGDYSEIQIPGYLRREAHTTHNSCGRCDECHCQMMKCDVCEHMYEYNIPTPSCYVCGLDGCHYCIAIRVVRREGELEEVCEEWCKYNAMGEVRELFVSKQIPGEERIYGEFAKCVRCWMR
jgi:hypothetical protein